MLGNRKKIFRKGETLQTVADDPERPGTAVKPHTVEGQSATRRSKNHSLLRDGRNNAIDMASTAGGRDGHPHPPRASSAASDHSSLQPPQTRAATPIEELRHAMPRKAKLVLAAEMNTPIALDVSIDQHVTLETKTCVDCINQLLQRFPGAIAKKALEDTNHSRDVLNMVAAFLANISSMGNTRSTTESGEASPANVHRAPHSTLEAQLKGVSAFFPWTLLSVSSVGGDGLDVARQALDGSRRVRIARIPLSLKAVTEEVSEAFQRCEHAEETYRQRLSDEGADSAAMAAAFIAWREAEHELSAAMENKAIVRFALETQDTAKLAIPAIGADSATAASGTPVSGASETAISLEELHGNILRGIRSIEQQMKALTNTPSTHSAGPRRTVSVDLMEIYQRDRASLRVQLDLIERCVQDKRCYTALHRLDQQRLHKALQLTRSSQFGRDEEIERANAINAGLMRELRAQRREIGELKGIIHRSSEHISLLEQHIEASRRAVPVPRLTDQRLETALHSPRSSPQRTRSPPSPRHSASSLLISSAAANARQLSPAEQSALIRRLFHSTSPAKQPVSNAQELKERSPKESPQELNDRFYYKELEHQRLVHEKLRRKFVDEDGLSTQRRLKKLSSRTEEQELVHHYFSHSIAKMNEARERLFIEHVATKEPVVKKFGKSGIAEIVDRLTTKK
jgi:hypothetical protein